MILPSNCPGARSRSPTLSLLAVRSQEKKLLLFLGGRLVGREDAGMSGLRVLRNGALAGWLLLCLARPSVAGPPPAPAPPGLITGVCSVFAGAAVASLACDHHLAGLRVRVDALRRPQIDAIDPLRVHFSLHDRASWELTKADISAGFCGNSFVPNTARAPGWRAGLPNATESSRVRSSSVDPTVSEMDSLGPRNSGSGDIGYWFVNLERPGLSSRTMG